jgi:hypothetical protein
MSPFTLSRYYGNATTHCHATVTVTLLWKCYKLTVIQQALVRYYGNAIKDITCHIAPTLTLFVPSSHQVRRQSVRTSHYHLRSNVALDLVDCVVDLGDVW